MQDESQAPRTVRVARRLLALGASTTVVGLAIAATSPVAGTAGSERAGAQELAGGLVVFVGWVVIAWGIHRFGRQAG